MSLLWCWVLVLCSKKINFNLWPLWICLLSIFYQENEQTSFFLNSQGFEQRQQYGKKWTRENMCSTLITREMKNLNHNNIPFILIRMTKRMDNTKCWWESKMTTTQCILLMGMQNGTPLWKTVVIFYKVTYTLTTWPSNLIPSIPKWNKNIFMHNCQKLETTQNLFQLVQWINYGISWYIHAMEYYSQEKSMNYWYTL